MKKILLTFLGLMMIISTSFAYTLTIVRGDNSLVVDRSSGSEIELNKIDPNLEGWEVVEGGVNIVDNKFIMPEANVKINAKMPQTYTIGYSANGGSLAPINQEKVHNVDLILSSDVVTRDGYRFLGWSTDKNATSAMYQPGDTFTSNQNATLYAVWANETMYVVRYYTKKGTIFGGTEKVYEKAGNSYITIEDPSAEREGCTFLGWSTDGDDTTVEYNVGSWYRVTGDVTFTAVWDEPAIILIDNVQNEYLLSKNVTIRSNAQTTINWGDGTVQNINASGSDTTLNHTYSSLGRYVVTIEDNVLTKFSTNYNDSVIALDVTKASALTYLDCSGAWEMTDLDLTNNTNLAYLNCSMTQVTNLDTSKNTKLEELYCDFGSRNLDLRNNLLLRKLTCCSTSLTSLDISKNTLLTELNCSANSELTNLDVTNNTELTHLDCQGTKIVSLNLSKNTKLETLYCGDYTDSPLVDLDVSNNLALSYLNYYGTGTLVTDSRQVIEKTTDAKTICITQTENGKISYQGGLTFNITPDEGYQIETLTVGGVQVTPSRIYRFGSVIEDTTITATYSRFYTQEDIDNSNGLLYAIGKNNPLNVIAAFNEDFTEVTISKNGENSDGIIKDYTDANPSPMTQKASTLTTLNINEGVTLIGTRSFYNCNKLTGDLVIPEGVTKITTSAFYGCSGLNGTLTLPSSLTTMAAGAFKNCTGFTGDLVIPEGVTTLGDEVFSGCTGFNGTLTLPSTLTAIGYSNFNNCKNLTGDLVIPEGITSIGTLAFYNCSGFNGNLVLPNGLETIDRQAFYNCSGLNGNLVLPNGLTTIGKNAFYACKRLTGSLDLPDTLTTIEDTAFYGCTGFTGELVLPSNLSTLGLYAFSDCAGLTGTVTIPATVTTIGANPFRRCEFTAINVDSDNENYVSDGGVLFDKDKTHLIAYPKANTATEYTIPETVTNIGEAAFYNCSKLRGILTLPSNLITIGNSAFTSCGGFTGTVVIPSTVTTIGKNPFAYSWGIRAIEVDSDNLNYTSIDGVLFNKDKTKLVAYPKGKYDTEYIVPEGVVEIMESSLVSCEKIITLVIPNTVTTIGASGLSGCNNLETIYFNGTLEQWNAISFGSGWNSSCGAYTVKFYYTQEDIDNSDGRIVAIGATNPLYVVAEFNEDFTSVRIRKNHVDSDGVIKNYNSSSVSPMTSHSSTLTSVNIMPGVTVIGNRAFNNCSKLAGSLVIPEGVTKIGDQAFYNCSNLTGSLEFPSSLAIIGGNAFYGCSGLTGALTLPSNLTTLGSHAFYNCTGFTGSVVIPSSVTNIADNPFRGSNLESIEVDSENLSYSSEDGVLFDKNKEFLIAYPKGKELSEYTMPDTVTRIGAYAFANCSNVTGTLTLSNNLTTIDNLAFVACVRLTGTVIIPEKVTSIGNNPFLFCDNLSAIEVDSDNLSYTSIDGVLYNKSKTELISYPGGKTSTELVIPEGVTTLKNSAVKNAKKLVTIVIPNTVTIIEADALATGNNLETIYFNGTEEEWNAISFGVNWNLNCGDFEVKFYYTQEDIDNSEGRIVAIGATNPLYVVAEFNEDFTEVRIKKNHVNSDGLIANYTTSNPSPMTEHASTLTSFNIMPEVANIGAYAFYNCSNLTGDLVIPEGVTSIGESAFYNCSNLTGDLIIPDGVVSIGSNAFNGCSGFSGRLIMPESLSVIGNYAFSYCTSLIGDLIIPNGVTQIGEYAFYECNNLSGSLKISNNATTIGRAAFYNCKNLIGNVIIPENVASIGSSAFHNCMGLTNIVISGNILGIENYTFANCSELTNITIPSTITYIGSNAFANCGKLLDITIPELVTQIGEYAFYECGSLTGDLVIPDGVTSIERTTFYNCAGITSVVIPNNITTIGVNAFRSCSNLTTINYKGTEAEWNAITFGSDWDLNSGAYTINFNYGEEIVYTQEDIDNSEGRLVAIGATNPLYVVGEYNEDFTEVVIKKNGSSSDGRMGNYSCNMAAEMTLERAVIEEGIVNIGDNLFLFCMPLTDVTIPDSVTSIGTNAFGYTAISSITIPRGVTSIGGYAFSGCSNLTTINYKGTEEEWNTITFGEEWDSYTGEYTVIFTETKTYTQEDIDNSNGRLIAVGETNPLYVVAEYNEDRTELTIKKNGRDSDGIMKDYDFMSAPDWSFSNVETVIIEDGITNLSYFGFYYCENLTTVEIPRSVTIIEGYAFESCLNLATINYRGTEEEWNAITLVTDWDSATGDYIINFNYGEEIAYTQEDIDNSNGRLIAVGETNPLYVVAEYNEDRTELTIKKNGRDSDGIMKNHTGALAPDWVFEGITATTIKVEEGVTNISSYGFSYLEISTVEIPRSVTEIGDGAFYSCLGLTNIIYNGTEEEWNAITFGTDWDSYAGEYTVIFNGIEEVYTQEDIDNSNGRLIAVGETNPLYVVAEFNEDFTEVRIKKNHADSDGLMGRYCCSGVAESTLTRAVIGEGIVNIGENLFTFCMSLTDVTIPDSVTTIENYAFQYTGISSITIPGGVISIGDYAFSGCENLNTIIFKGTEEEWNTITFGEEWDSYAGEYTVIFNGGQTGYTQEDIDNSNGRLIAAGATDPLYVVGEYEEGVELVIKKNRSNSDGRMKDFSSALAPDWAFEFCYVPRVIIEEGIVNISSWGFSYHGMETIEIPESVTEIGDGAFAYSSLTTINYRGTEEQWNLISFGTDWDLGTGAYTINYNYKESYIVSYDINGGTNQPAEQVKVAGEVLELTTIVPEKVGYVFKGWSTNINATNVNYLSGADYKLDQNMILYAVWEAIVLPPANSPMLTDGLTPLNYNETTSNWDETDLLNWIYDYDLSDGETKWANAKTSDGTQYVWIPRYSYHIEEGNKISWNAEVPGTARTYIVFSSGKNDYTLDPTGATNYEYTSHPAFTMKDTVNNKTYELSGIWVEKYESEDEKTLNDAFTTCLDADSEFDTHLIKDWEWLAVAGLTSAIGKIPTNTNGSTTHNVYGIYDMANSNSEFTASYDPVCFLESDGYKEDDIEAVINSYNDYYGEKYVNNPYVYEMYATPSADYTSWDNGYAYTLGYPLITRGYESNIFSYNCVGTSSSAHYRKVLTPESSDNSTICYTVIFDSDMGILEAGTEVARKYKGQSIEIINTPVKEGYKFVGWSTEKEYQHYYISEAESRTEYKNGDIYSEDRNITLYAVWCAYIDITFYAPSGYVEGASEYYTYKVPIGYAITFPSAYNVIGWKEEGTGEIYEVGDICVKSARTTFTAVYDEDDGDGSGTGYVPNVCEHGNYGACSGCAVNGGYAITEACVHGNTGACGECMAMYN